ncbi:MAG: AAA family ATPase [Clostridiales bacterium]|nr:AAA family ATPase [Clostridiales bacterium]
MPDLPSSLWIERDLLSEVKGYIESSRRIHRRKGVFLKGMRQAGKTELINAIGRDLFKRQYYVNLLEDEKAKADLEKLLKKTTARSTGTFMDYDKRFISAMFKEYFGDQGDRSVEFIDDADSVLFIDEIFESRTAFGLMRWIVRGLDAQVVFSASWCGEIIKMKGVFKSIGDTFRFTLNSVSFYEFLKCADAWGAYDQIGKVTLSADDYVSIEAFANVKKYYDAYALLGGFPSVLSAYLKDNDEKKALEHIPKLYPRHRKNPALKHSPGFSGAIDASNLLFESLVHEIREKTRGDNNLEKWESALGIIVNGIVSGLHSSFIYDKVMEHAGETCSKNYDNPCDELDLRHLIEWLSLSNVIVPCPILDLKNNQYPSKYMFSDLGLLRYFCEIFKISDSMRKGFAAENFVALTDMPILDALEYPGLECFDSSVLESPEEAIFIIRTPREKTILLQARSSSSGMNSSEKKLARGEADYVIRLTDQLGNWNPGERIVTMPIYALDKLPMVLSRMDAGELEEKGPNAEA